MPPPPTIVFGPTGNIGSVVARSLGAQDGKVVLAMRDTKKSIRGLSPEDEKTNSYERVQADMTKPDTILEAVKKTGAKRAFIYLDFTSQDHMHTAAKALKAGGIEYVVFLSAVTIQEDIHTIPMKDLPAWAHAKVEVTLEQVFGPDNYTAVRPGWFATNAIQYSDIPTGEARLFEPDVKYDWIDTEDIGRVCAAILATGPSSAHKTRGKSYVELVGPELISQEACVNIIAAEAGLKVKVISLSKDDGLKNYLDKGLPEAIAQYRVALFTEIMGQEGGRGVHPCFSTIDRSAKTNIERFSGRTPTTFRQWAQRNKHLFQNSA